MATREYYATLAQLLLELAAENDDEAIAALLVERASEYMLLALKPDAAGPPTQIETEQQQQQQQQAQSKLTDEDES